MSHRVSEFERQLSIVRSRFTVVTDIAGGGSGRCIITFDDGYKNNLIAAKILEAHGARGVFFVPIQPLLSRQTMTIDRVLMWFSYVPQGQYLVASQPVIVADERRDSAYAKFYGWMLGHVERWSEVPDALNQAVPFDQISLPVPIQKLRFEPMILEDLDDLRSAGHVIGCHSWDHRPLAALDDAHLREDFDQCTDLKSRFDMRYYCYPFGGPAEVDRRAIHECEAQGYAAAVLNTAFSSYADCNPAFALPRCSLPQIKNRYLIEAKLCGLEDAIKGVLRLQ